jgi:hypothetical protein
MAGENTVLTSIHGREVGLNADRNLVVGGKVVTDKAAAVGAKNGATVTEVLIDGPVRKVTLTCAITPIVITDEAGQGQFGPVKVYDFPEGLLLFLGAVIDGSFTVDDSEMTDTFDGDVALGTAAAADAQGQDGTTDDLLQTTAMTQAIAQVANCDAVTIATKLTESGARWHDGTATAKDMYLNFEIDDQAAHITGTGSFTGAIQFAYIILGDN